MNDPRANRDARAEGRAEPAERIRQALLAAALAAYDDAGIQGLCEEGRWEAAVGAMRRLDLGDIDTATARPSPRR